MRATSLLFRWIRGQRWNIAAMGAVAEEAAMEALDLALSMCGNEGQVSIIEMTEDSFTEAAYAAMGDGDPLAVLVNGCPYPDAVIIILEAAADLIMEIISSMGEVDDDEGDEGEEGEEFD